MIRPPGRRIRVAVTGVGDSSWPDIVAFAIGWVRDNVAGAWTWTEIERGDDQWHVGFVQAEPEGLDGQADGTLEP